MQAAIDEARAAGERGEVPVGAIVVTDDEVVARAGNRTILDSDPTAHAEMVVLREAAKKIGNYRLLGSHSLRDDRAVRDVRWSDDPSADCAAGLWCGRCEGRRGTVLF
jgi:pyrimidine deaminase RibD-like protein